MNIDLLGWLLVGPFNWRRRHDDILALFELVRAPNRGCFQAGSASRQFDTGCPGQRGLVREIDLSIIRVMSIHWSSFGQQNPAV